MGQEACRTKQTWEVQLPMAGPLHNSFSYEKLSELGEMLDLLANGEHLKHLME